MAALTSIFVGVLYFVGHVSCDCDPHYGPSGRVECVRFSSYYSQYQYATCLTDSYIKERSDRKHKCKSSTVRYCYYQCMLELNNIESGPVYRNCSCNPNKIPEQTATLPDWCYSPDGTSCEWFRNCLEKRYPCRNEENSYALDFGEKFCSLYTQHYSRLNGVGRRWINAVRKCLQVSLVDLLRPYQHPTCDKIKTRAFDSHNDCYLKPLDGIIFFCDIGFGNWLQVLVTVYSSLTQKQVIGEALVTAGECFNYYINHTVSMEVSWTDIQISKIKKMVTDVYTAANDKLADDVYMVVLNSNQLSDVRSSTARQPFNSSIKLLMVPRNKYDLNYSGRSSLRTDELVTSFLDLVQSGEITFKELDGIKLLEYKECNDTECQFPLRTVNAPPPTPTPTPNTSMASFLKYPFKLLFGSYLIAATMLM